MYATGRRHRRSEVGVQHDREKHRGSQGESRQTNRNPARQTVGAVLLPVSAANRVAALVVLVVEDEPLLRYSVAEFLREAGYTVVERASGEEAIALCKSNMSIDVVFTDITLTGAATGWDVADRMRADRPQVSVLYTSGNRIDPGRCVPGSAFIAKPYQHDERMSAPMRKMTFWVNRVVSSTRLPKWTPH